MELQQLACCVQTGADAALRALEAVPLSALLSAFCALQVTCKHAEYSQGRAPMFGRHVIM